MSGKCLKRCCLIPRMAERLKTMLEKEFPNRKEYKLSYTTTNKEQIHIHIECESLKVSTVKKIEHLYYEIKSVWVQPFMGISLAVIPDDSYVKQIMDGSRNEINEDKI